MAILQKLFLLCFPEQAHLVSKSVTGNLNPVSSTPTESDRCIRPRIPGITDLTSWQPLTRRATIAQLNEAANLVEVQVHSPSRKSSSIEMSELC